MVASPRVVSLPPPRSPRRALPWPIPPMMATLAAELPADADRYAYEFKWDGYRTLLFVEGGKARVQSRNLRDVTAEYPELQAVARAVPAGRAILDGEVVVLDEAGRPSFQLLQNRAGFRGPKVMAPITFIAFDLLWLEDQPLFDLPWERRREALEELGLEGEGVLVPPASRDGPETLEASRRLGLEGVVAKRRDSPYEQGRRGGAWRKVKVLRRQEFVIGGWTRGAGGRRRTLGALLLGVHEGGALRFAGRVGTGFTDAMLEDLRARLAPLERPTSPFAGAVPEDVENVFVEPRLVCEVAFAEWTHDHQLRHPSYQGLRQDKPARDVVREPTPDAQEEP